MICMSLRKQAVFFFLAVFLCVGTLLRLYKSNEHFMFSWDQAMNMYVWQDMHDAIKTGEYSRLPIRGEPGESPDQEALIYHGSFYLYFMLPIAIATHFNPSGIVQILSVLNALGILLMYVAGRMFFDKRTGLIAAFFYAVSFWMVAYGNEIWTPTLQPLFVLISLVGLAGVLYKKEGYWPLLGFGAAAVSQVHSSGYLFFFFLLFCIVLYRIRPKTWQMLLGTLVATILPMSPTLYYEATNGFHLPFIVQQAFVTQLMKTAGEWTFNGAVREVFERFIGTVLVSMGVAASSLLLSWPQYLLAGLLILVGGWTLIRLLSGIFVWRKKLQLPHKIFLWFLFLFLPIPWVAQVYYHRGAGLSEWILTRMFFAVPILFLVAAHCIHRMLFVSRWRVIATIAVCAYFFVNFSLIYTLGGLHDASIFDYTEKKAIAEYIARDAGSTPFTLVYPQGQHSWFELLYFFDEQHSLLPERINGKTQISFWWVTKMLRNEPSALQYLLLPSDDVRFTSKKNMRNSFSTPHFLIYRVEEIEISESID